MMVTLEKPAFVESNVATWRDADYKRLLAEVDSLFHAERSNPEFVRLDALITLIEEYETAQGWDLPEPTPAQREQVRREQVGVAAGAGELVAT